MTNEYQSSASENWVIIQQLKRRVEELEATGAKKRKRRGTIARLSLILLTVASAVAVTSNAFASIPDGNGVVTFCYNTSSGNARLIDAASEGCKNHENALKLLAQGASINAGQITGTLPASSIPDLGGKYALKDGSNATGTWPVSINGNAATVTNGLYDNQSYNDPTWLRSLSGTKVSGNISGNAAGFTGNLSGDVTGGQNSTKVTGLQGQGISAPGSASGQYLRFDGTVWTPSSLAASDIPDLSGSYVSLSGDQTIGGTKTFTNGIKFGDGTTQTSAVTSPNLFCPGCDKTGAHLAGAQLNGAYFPAVRLNFSDLTGAKLTAADLNFAGLLDAKLGGAVLDGANLSNARMICGNVNDTPPCVDVSNANMNYTDLTAAIAQANFSNTNMTGANLTGGLFSGSDFSNAYMVYANLTDASLYHATGLSTAHLQDAIYLHTTCPDGSNSDNDGGTCSGHF